MKFDAVNPFGWCWFVKTKGDRAELYFKSSNQNIENQNPLTY
jgi:hypothetical protein